MEFRLLYSGELFATQPDDKKAADKRRTNKYNIRRELHAQLKRLWATTPHLIEGANTGPVAAVDGDHKAADLAARHAHFGFNWVPLVTRDRGLLCGIEVLFLRPEPPGSAIQSGDIDNRMKTFFDALAIPTANEGYASRTPQRDEKPFFILLEDDRLITKVSLETDQLLRIPDGASGQHWVSLVITVRIRPIDTNLTNIQFV